jgi:polyribonucleotide 5'-hydroxyl-kinase
VKYSGIIVDSSSQFVSNPEVLEKAIGYFDSNLQFNTVNVLIVIGHERLLSDLQRKYTDNDQMKILKLAKSGGVVTRDRAAKRQMHLQRVKEYFYGTVGNDLTPFSQTVSFSDIIVRRAVEGSIAPSSALPIGMEVNSQEIKFVKVDAGDILLHSILAVSFAPLPGSEARLDSQGNPKIYTPEEEAQALLSSNISGFIYISEVDEKKRKMTILCPNPGRLPKCYLIMGSLKWMDA